MPRRHVLLLGLLWRCAIATKQECAVCEDTIGHLAASAAAKERSEPGVRAVLDAYCEQERLNTAEAQMCYVLEPMRQQVSAWVALGVDPRRTCAKINRMNGEACALFHESDFILAAHVGHMANLVCAGPGTVVVEMACPSRGTGWWEQIPAFFTELNLTYSYFPAVRSSCPRPVSYTHLTLPTKA